MALYLDTFSFLSPDGNVLRFTFTPSTGNVTCFSCGIRWCEHVKLFMMSGGDSIIVWEKPENAEYKGNLFLNIPMFPTEDLFIRVLLERVDALPRYRVTWAYDLEVQFLCFLNPGEGRRVIRNIFIENMKTSKVEEQTCRAPHHSVHAELTWQEMTRLSHKRSAQYWSIYTTGQCLTCAKVDPTADPDLVPEQQRSGVWNG